VAILIARFSPVEGQSVMQCRSVRLLSALALLALAGIACSLPLAPATPGATPPGGEEVIATTAPEQPTAPPTEADPTAICPAATPGTAQLIDPEGGFCLLYPERFTVSQDIYGTNLVGPPLDDSMEPAAAFLSINVIAAPGAAAGITAGQWADQQIALYPDLAGQITREETTLAGQPAVAVTGLPAYLGGRDTYVVVNNTLYAFHLHPVDNLVPIAQPDSDEVWATVSSSLAFFPPPPAEFVLPEDVCPAAGAGQAQYVNREAGYCFLHPAAFQPEPSWPGVIAGGPDLPTLPDYVFPERKVSIAVGLVGPTDGKSVQEMIEPYLVNTNPATTTRQDITIGGFPAIVIEDTADPIGQRTGFVVADDTLYTILIKPSNAANYPEAAEAVEQLWSSVTQSMTFFTAWN